MPQTDPHATGSRAAKDCALSAETVRTYLHDVLCPLCGKFAKEHETAAEKRARRENEDA